MKIATRPSVSATMPTNATVSRAWNVLGTSRFSPREMDRPDRSSALGEGVTDTAHRLDERWRGGIVLDLVAQVAHVDVDRLLVLVEGLVITQELQQLASRVHAARPRREVTQDLELRGGQADPALAALDAPALQVDHEVAVADDPAAGGVGEVAVGPTEECLDPAHQLAEAVRLRQVVVGAQLEADHLVDLVVAGGQDEDRRLRAGGTEPAEHLEAVDPGQPDVENHEIRGLVRREVEALFAAAGDRDLVALLLQRVLDAARDGELVFDDEDRGAHGAGLYTDMTNVTARVIRWVTVRSRRP